MQKGMLINKAGRGRYRTEKSVKALILYVLREREDEDRKDELLCWGACGAAEWGGVGEIVGAFDAVRQTYGRKGEFVRYIDHEIYLFSDEEQRGLRMDAAAFDRVAREMAEDIYREGYQVVYGIHKKEGKEGVHVHLAVNTVSYREDRKRREDMAGTQRREERFQQIVQEGIRECVLVSGGQRSTVPPSTLGAESPDDPCTVSSTRPSVRSGSGGHGFTLGCPSPCQRGYRSYPSPRHGGGSNG